MNKKLIYGFAIIAGLASCNDDYTDWSSPQSNSEHEAVEKFTGTVIAVVHRNDDVEEKWVVVPEGMTFTKEEIMKQIYFQEQYFDSKIMV